MMTPSRWAFAVCVLLAVLALAVPLLFYGPPPEPAVPLDAGFRSPLLALELADRTADIDFLTGEAGAPMRDWIRHVQRLDILMPLLWGGMAIALFFGMALRGNFLALAGIGLVIAVMIADWQENATIAGILDEIENPLCNADTIPPDADGPVVLRDCLGAEAFADAPPALLIASFALDSFLPLRVELLRADTWMKRGLTAAVAGLLAALLWFRKRLVMRLLALPPALAVLAIGITRLSGSNGHVAEIMSILLIPFVLTFPAAAVMYFPGKPMRDRQGGTRAGNTKHQVKDTP